MIPAAALSSGGCPLFFAMSDCGDASMTSASWPMGLVSLATTDPTEEGRAGELAAMRGKARIGMKVYQIYNEQRSRFGGEPAVVDATMRVLAQNGHESRLVMKSSRVLENSIVKRIYAFCGGVYNIRAYNEMRRLLEEDRPDVVHVHSVYPMFSPSMLVACRRAGVPVVMTVHSHNLTCPTWYHLHKGRVCEDCVGGHEYRCVLKNCRNNIFESSAYALRSSVARRFRLFHDNVSVLIVLTPFGKERLLQAGFRDDQIAVIPNPTSVRETILDRPVGEYVAFSGRVSPEKGVDIFLAAASRMPDVPFKVAGDGPVLSEMRTRAPRNVEFLGRLGSDELLTFYRRSRILAVPSLWFEPFGLVVVEAMALGVPVVASRIGGLPYVVDDGVTGLLFEPGSPEGLVKDVRRLWEDPQLCDRMGRAGRQKVMREYSEEAYYQNLMVAYQTAIQRSRQAAELFPILVTDPSDSMRAQSETAMLRE
jgi:glycosyltransferase involved in cell wall biosynthesis